MNILLCPLCVFGFHQIHISVFPATFFLLGFLILSLASEFRYFLSALPTNFRLRKSNSQLRWLWWAQVESNHRPHAYQACALTFWAMSPCYLHNHRNRLIRRSVPWTYGFGLSTDGGDEGIRTLDPLLAGQVLSQLSYTPIFEVRSKSE